MRPQHDDFVPTGSVRYPITYSPSGLPFGIPPAGDGNARRRVDGRWSVGRAMLLALLASLLLWSLFAATLYAALH